MPNFRFSERPVYLLQQIVFVQAQICHSYWPHHAPCWLAQRQTFWYEPYQIMQLVLIVLSLHPLLPCFTLVLCLAFLLAVESFLQRLWFLQDPLVFFNYTYGPHRTPTYSYLLLLTCLSMSRFSLRFFPTSLAPTSPCMHTLSILFIQTCLKDDAQYLTYSIFI